MNFFLLAFVFSRENRRPKGAKSKHIFENEGGKQLETWSAWLLSSCPLVAGVPALWGLSSLWWRVPSFCSSYRFASGAALANVALFRVFRAFLAGFERFVWVYVACVLCVACGAFVCVNS